MADDGGGRRGSRPAPARGRRVRGGGGSALSDGGEQDRRDEVADGVDGDGDRRGQDLDQEAADAEGRELGSGAARRQGGVRVDELLPLDDRRQVGVVGRVEERGEDRGEADTTSSCQNVRTPRAKASGIEPSRTARPRSAQIRTGRRRRRSTQAPATRPKTSVAISSTARRSATSIAPEPRTRMAANGSASRVTSDPKIEIVAALQTRTKAWLRQSVEANGLRTDRAA